MLDRATLRFVRHPGSRECGCDTGARAQSGHGDWGYLWRHTHWQGSPSHGVHARCRIEPKRGTIKHIPVAIEGFCEARVPKQQLYSDPHIHPRTARCGAASGGIGLVMEPVSIEAAIEKAKKKGLRPGRVKGTDGIQFTKGRNNRIEVISWEEFRSTLSDRQLEVFDSNGFMKIMKKR